jgi:hypothetical protein
MKYHLAIAVLISIQAPACEAAVTGQWDFDAGDLRGTIGPPLKYLDGSTGATVRATGFNTTEKFGIPGIGGATAKVMRFPRMESPFMGYVVTHGVEPNGDGMRVNQYTVVMDVYSPAASSGAFRSLFQTDNEDQADFYLNPANAVGVSANYSGEVAADKWHRIAMAVDVSGRLPTVLKFVDGVKAGRQTLTQGRDGRWSLGPEFHLFQDPAGDSQSGYLNSLQVRDRTLSEAELRLLGGPTPGGIPTNDLPVSAYVDKTVPDSGVFGVADDADIQAEIVDGQHPLERETVKLIVNSQAASASLSRAGTRTIVRYRPAAPLPATNTVVLSYRSGGAFVTNAWSFVKASSDRSRAVMGQWDFEHGDLRATVGNPLRYLDGTNGASRRAVEFESTTAFGVGEIQGQPARVMRFAGATGRNIGLVMSHGVSPNGGEGITRVNQWTFIVDLMIPNAHSEQWFALVQTDMGNTSDTDVCVRFENKSGGIGIRGQYMGEGSIVPGRWHRLAVAFDLAGSTMEKYIDGSLFAVQQLPDSEAELDGRFSLGPSALLFADEDGESQVAYINSIQVRNYAMDADEIRRLGGPTAQGISTNSLALTK